VTNKRKPINFVANKSLFDDRSEKGSVYGKRANVGVVLFSLYSIIIISWFIQVPENIENDLDPIEEPIDQFDTNESLYDNEVCFEKLFIKFSHRLLLFQLQENRTNRRNKKKRTKSRSLSEEGVDNGNIWPQENIQSMDEDENPFSEENDEGIKKKRRNRRHRRRDDNKENIEAEVNKHTEEPQNLEGIQVIFYLNY
jgi:hypothetical protein